MLVNLKEILDTVVEEKYAVANFTVVNLEMARGVIEAAEEADCPVILGIEEKLLDICSIYEFASFALPMARMASVPVGVHFDHGYTFEKCTQALRAGFTSVNYDCSALPFEENVGKVLELTKVAHAFGASVEAELGRVPEATELEERERTDYHTKPDQAAEFAKRTGIDALAIAAGNAQGTYLSAPNVDFDRIREISDAAKLPLVLHGGSGLSDRMFRRAIDCGVHKINVFTDIDIACGQGILQAVNSGLVKVSDIIPYAVHSVKIQAMEKIGLFRNR